MPSAAMLLSLHMTGHLSRAIPWRLEELPVDDFHKGQALGAFTAGLVLEAGPRQRQQAALSPDAEIGMILLHRFFASSAENETGGCRQKIPLDDQLADLGMQLLDLTRGDLRLGGRGAAEGRGHVLDCGAFLTADHRRMDIVFLGQFGRRQFLADGFQSHRRFELCRIALAFRNFGSVLPQALTDC